MAGPSAPTWSAPARRTRTPACRPPLAAPSSRNFSLPAMSWSSTRASSLASTAIAFSTSPPASPWTPSRPSACSRTSAGSARAGPAREPHRVASSSRSRPAQRRRGRPSLPALTRSCSRRRSGLAAARSRCDSERASIPTRGGRGPIRRAGRSTVTAIARWRWSTGATSPPCLRGPRMGDPISGPTRSSTFPRCGGQSATTSGAARSTRFTGTASTPTTREKRSTRIHGWCSATADTTRTPRTGRSSVPWIRRCRRDSAEILCPIPCSTT